MPRWRALGRLLLLGELAAVSMAGNVVQQQLYGLDSGLAYYVSVTIGQPVYSSATASSATNSYKLLIDTGSSNTAVVTPDCCADSNEHTYKCAQSATCIATSTTVNVSYITGAWSGDLVYDTFSSEGYSAISAVPFTEIVRQSNFIQEGYDGIIGLAFDSIASPNGRPPRSYFEEIAAAKNLPNVISLLMCGALQPLLFKTIKSTADLYAGELLLGGTEGPSGEVYYEGDLVYTPLVQERWYNVLVTELKVGNEALNIDCREINTPKAIVDSGTSNIALPSIVYTAVVDELKTQVAAILPSYDSNLFNDEVACCSKLCDPTNANSKLMTLPSLSISLAVETSDGKQQQVSVTIPPEYIWRPVYRQTFLGSESCRVFGISEGDITLLGDVFMDGLFTVHDREGKQLGLGVAKACPNAVNSTKQVRVEALNSNIDSFCKCLSTTDRPSNLLSSYMPFSSKPCFFVLWWMYIILVSVCLIAISLTTIIWICVKRRLERRRRRRAHRPIPVTPGMERNLLASECDGCELFTPPASKASTATTRPSDIRMSLV